MKHALTALTTLAACALCTSCNETSTTTVLPEAAATPYPAAYPVPISAAPAKQKEKNYRQQLECITIRKVEFNDIYIDHALDSIRNEIRKKGLSIPIIWKPAPGTPYKSPEIHSLKLYDVSVIQLLENICLLADCQYRISKHNGVVIHPR